MVACSKNNRSKCKSPCVWIVGRGCRSKSARRKSASAPRQAKAKVKARARVSARRERSVRAKKTCSHGQILNPDTNRCVNSRGRIGQQIRLRGHKLRGSEQSAGQGQVEDNEYFQAFDQMDDTFTGNINRKIQTKYGHGIFESLASLLEIHPSDIIFRRFIGAGSYGSVFLVSLANKATIIIKVQVGQSKKEIEHEYYMHERFYHYRIGAPKPYFLMFYKKIALIGMQLKPHAIKFGVFSTYLRFPLNKKILQYMIDSVDHLVHKMCKHDLIHADMHWGNIGFQRVVNEQPTNPTFKFNYKGEVHNLTPMIIDFGFAKEAKCFPDVELIQLVRTLYPQFNNAVHPKNRDFLYNRLIELISKYSRYKINLSEHPRWTYSELEQIEKLYSKFMKRL